MNRRAFFKSVGAAIASVVIRPSAPLDARFIPNPDWVDAEYDIHFWTPQLHMDGIAWTVNEVPFTIKR